MRILLIEDHPRLREMTRAHLSECGFVVDAFSTVEDGRSALAEVVYDAMVLDLGLPDGDGTELIRWTAGGAPVPTLILTARDQVDDRISVLNAGADDYLVKPFDLGELEARLRAILRRPGSRRSVVLTYGALSLDVATRQARAHERPFDLGRRESLLLEALLRAQGAVVVRDALDERLYGYDDQVTPNALEAAVSRLRRSLADAGAEVTVEAQRGVGYRLRPVASR
jgi:two-component system response regulator QseB